MQHRVLGGTQRIFRAASRRARGSHLAGDARRAAGHQGRHRLTRAVLPVGIRSHRVLEHPELWGGLADLAPDGTDDWPRLIHHIVAAPKGEDQIALRIARRLCPAAHPSGGGAERHPARTTPGGDLSGHGWAWRARTRVRRVSRRKRRGHARTDGPSSTRRCRSPAHRSATRAVWLPIVVVAADVADADDVTRLLADIRMNCRRWRASCTLRASSAPVHWPT